MNNVKLTLNSFCANLARMSDLELISRNIIWTSVWLAQSRRFWPLTRFKLNLTITWSVAHNSTNKVSYRNNNLVTFGSYLIILIRKREQTQRALFGNQTRRDGLDGRTGDKRLKFCASSESLERLFSTVSRLPTDLRSLTKCETFEFILSKNKDARTFFTNVIRLD